MSNLTEFHERIAHLLLETEVHPVAAIQRIADRINDEAAMEAGELEGMCRGCAEPVNNGGRWCAGSYCRLDPPEVESDVERDRR